MNDLNYLIKPIDYYLLLAFFVTGYFVLHYLIFRNTDRKLRHLLTSVYILKTIGCVTMSLLIVYYWKVSDTVNYFTEGENLAKFAKADITNVKYFFLPLENYELKIKFDNELIQTVNGIGLESNFMISRFCGLLYPLGFGRFLLVNFLFCFIAVISQFVLFKTLYNRYRTLKKSLAICILFVPTLILYSSFINKECLCFAFISFALYAYFKIISNKSPLSNALILLIWLLLIYILKPYVLYALIMALFIFFIVRFAFKLYRGSLFLKAILFTGITLIIVFFYNYPDIFDGYILSITDLSNIFQDRYNIGLDDTSAFKIGEVDPTLTGLLLKAPVALFTTYFRPGLWEVNKPIILFSAIEATLTLLLVCYVLIKKGIYIRKLMKIDSFAAIVFYYFIALGIIIGLTTFNFGTLVRYKIPGIPFLLLFFLLLLNFSPNKPLQTPFYKPGKEL